MAADYSQIELRIMAHLSGDPALLRAFAEDRDIHQATAAEVMGKAIDDVTSEERRSAKAVNFGPDLRHVGLRPCQAAGHRSLAARSAMWTLLRALSGVKAFMDRTRAQAREQGYVETVRGRRLYLPDIRSRNRQLQQYAERSAINAPMQGTAADIIKLAMLKVEVQCTARKLPAKLIMQVHDELVMEVADTAVSEVSDMLRREMAAAEQLAVPLKVDIGTGSNWDEAH